MMKKRTLAFALLALLCTATVSSDSRAAVAPRRMAQYICGLTALFTADHIELVTTKARTEGMSKFSFNGSGLISCKASGGFAMFAMEIPVRAALIAEGRGVDLKGNELTLHAASSPFIVNREAGQIRDTYSVHSAASSILLEGDKHHLLIELKISSEKYPVGSLDVKSLKLDFDSASY